MTSTSFADLAGHAQTQALASLKQAQDLSIRGTEIALGLIPDPGSLGVDGKVPTPQEVMEASFTFAGQVLQQQKAYALRMTELVSDGFGKRAAGVAKPAAKA